jgi:hypothetical protein
MSEDPFYCGETFEKVEEVIPRKKHWRIRTLAEFPGNRRPDGWNESHMDYLYGQKIDAHITDESREEASFVDDATWDCRYVRVYSAHGENGGVWNIQWHWIIFDYMKED